jgi:hypothetical protein
MKYLAPYRVAAYLLVLFFLGHTVGGMISQQSFGPAADGVFAQMKSVHFDFNGADSSWYGFWLGFGLMISAFLLFVALTSWRLASVDAASWPTVAPIAWGLVPVMAFNTAMSWRYFFAGPGVISTLVTLLFIVGAWSKSRAKAEPSPAPLQA